MTYGYDTPSVTAQVMWVPPFKANIYCTPSRCNAPSLWGEDAVILAPEAWATRENFVLSLTEPSYHAIVSLADLGIFRRAAMVLYTDCIQQCSRPLYMVRACPVSLDLLPESRGRGGRASSGKSLRLPKSKGPAGPAWLTRSSQGKEACCIFFLWVKSNGMVPFLDRKYCSHIKKKKCMY